MKVAAIITEYNPFHNGHKYQIDKTIELLGEDTAIIAVMSGNYTQRGEIAVCDKTIRARSAVECGIDLVLELPFPFSMTSAEFFARCGVKIINSLGIVDYLVFGSESGDISLLDSASDYLLSDEFKKSYKASNDSAVFSNVGYATICEEILKRKFGNDLTPELFKPNNILAIEYLKALKESASNIKPLTIKRIGCGYNDTINESTDFQSASAIRQELTAESASALDYIPESAKSIYLGAISDGKMPSDVSRLDSAVIANFRLKSPTEETEIHDAAGGLYNRLLAKSVEATSISTLTSMTETKKYTKARIRRAIFYSYFGVTSSDVKELPAFTQVLAMNAKGRSLLKSIRKMTDFPVITKPSAYKSYGDVVIRQKELSNKADSVWQLTLKNPESGAFALKFSPYVKD